MDDSLLEEIERGGAGNEEPGGSPYRPMESDNERDRGSDVLSNSDFVEGGGQNELGNSSYWSGRRNGTGSAYHPTVNTHNGLAPSPSGVRRVAGDSVYDSQLMEDHDAEEEALWKELHEEEQGMLTGERMPSRSVKDKVKRKLTKAFYKNKRRLENLTGSGRSGRHHSNADEKFGGGGSGKRLHMSTMADFGLLGDEYSGGGTYTDEWGAVRNLDVFFTNLYKFYYSKGLTSMMVSGAMNLLTFLFTIFLSTFLLAFIQWDKMVSCRDEHTCLSFGDYIDWHAFSSPSTYTLVVFFYFLLFNAYWVWMVVNFVISMGDAMEMHRFYRDRLKITPRELQTMKWSVVVDKLLALHENREGSYKIQINKEKLDALDIASRIMRKDNYLVAFFAKDLLDLSIPLPKFMSERGHSRLYLTRNLEWNIHFCILNHMFTDSFTIRKQFLRDVRGLQRRFVLMGILNLAVLPFLLLFMVMHFFLKNAQDWHSQRAYLGPRQWSPLALWLFRDYNELPHVFERRINATYPYAEKYQNQFPVPILSTTARAVAFFSGSLVAVLLLMSLMEEGIILYMKLYDRNMLWYLTILTGIFAMARSLTPSPQDQVFAPERAMLKLAAYTHYYPASWRGKCHTYDVRDSFFELFQYKAGLFVQELLSVVLTPYLLCFRLPACAPAIVSFVADHTVDLKGVGSVCGYSLFNFKRYGDRRLGSLLGSEQHLNDQGKLEKSFLNFKEQHPLWKGSDEGEELLRRVKQFEHSQQEEQLETHLSNSLSSSSASAYGLASALKDSLEINRKLSFRDMPASRGGPERGRGRRSKDSILGESLTGKTGRGGTDGEERGGGERGGGRDGGSVAKEEEKEEEVAGRARAAETKERRGGGAAPGRSSQAKRRQDRVFGIEPDSDQEPHSGDEGSAGPAMSEEDEQEALSSSLLTAAANAGVSEILLRSLLKNKEPGENNFYWLEKMYNAEASVCDDPEAIDSQESILNRSAGGYVSPRHVPASRGVSSSLPLAPLRPPQTGDQGQM